MIDLGAAHFALKGTARNARITAPLAEPVARGCETRLGYCNWNATRVRVGTWDVSAAVRVHFNPTYGSSPDRRRPRGESDVSW